MINGLKPKNIKRDRKKSREKKEISEKLNRQITKALDLLRQDAQTSSRITVAKQKRPFNYKPPT
jgi:ABC-type enterochelin transport system ATPase subunit